MDGIHSYILPRSFGRARLRVRNQDVRMSVYLNLRLRFIQHFSHVLSLASFVVFSRLCDLLHRILHSYLAIQFLNSNNHNTNNHTNANNNNNHPRRARPKERGSETNKRKTKSYTMQHFVKARLPDSGFDNKRATNVGLGQLNERIVEDHLVESAARLIRKTKRNRLQSHDR